MKRTNGSIVKLWFWGLLLVFFHVFSASAAGMDGKQADRMTVGVKMAPPFVYQTEDGQWSGLTIQLWRAIAQDLGLQFEFQDLSLPQLLEAVQQGRIDVAAAALTVTAEREELMDFSHPYFTSGLGIATLRRHEVDSWAMVIKSIFSWPFFKALSALVTLLLAVSFLMWIFERKRNAAQFGGSSLRGIGSSFWWSAVTMTTVGYGDKAPRTLGGRLIAIVWMFTGIITISSFTAMITSALTVPTLQEALVQGPADLPRVRVGTVRESTSEEYVKKAGIQSRYYNAPQDALDDLLAGSLDAVVYDAPILRHLLLGQSGEQIEVLPGRFKRQEYALAFPQGSAWRESVNRALLRYQAGQEWREAVIQHLGVHAGGWLP